MVRQWHTSEVPAVFETLDSSENGLSVADAQSRLIQYGDNRLPDGGRKGFASIFLWQFADVMILVLLAAAVISGLVGDVQDTVAILSIVVINAVLGAVQQFRAEKAVAALKEMSTPDAVVIRGGKILTIPSVHIVPGDIVLLEAGNQIPADLRLIDTEQLEVDESALTGESRTVAKTNSALAKGDFPVADRTNMVYKSTHVTKGIGRGIVIATGLETEVGQIASLLQGRKVSKTPLQSRLAVFGRYLALAVIAICGLVFVAGLLQGQPVLLMFLTAVSLAVAAIPEALPAVVTISLALGAHKLIKFNALVRNLPSVETLGSVTYICTDKTGTLTLNRMSAEQIVTGNGSYTSLKEIEDNRLRDALGWVLSLNNDVANKDGAASGEPTELALYEFAAIEGFGKEDLLSQFPRIDAIPFDSVRKRMTTVHCFNQINIALVKGAPEAVLPNCFKELNRTDFNSDNYLQKASELAKQGYRILALAFKELDTPPQQANSTLIENGSELLEQDLTFLGLITLMDPPRKEAAVAVHDCHTAGITPVMITGDHPSTAQAIAMRLNICSKDDEIVTGTDLMKLSDEALSAAVKSIKVYARVSPEQKLRIVKALQGHGEFIAMTGDGVNDAPAIKHANIGIAMGLKGTDVARGAADMVLLDDNFSTIVNAVRAGRRIFDNIRKFISYTMSSNSGEIWTLFLAPFLGLPIPLLPIHILWINIVTDGLPGLAYTTEPADANIMRRPPRPPDENIFAHGMWQHILWVGLLIGGLSIAAQAWSISTGAEHWQTVVFTVLTVSQLFHAIAVRSESLSIFTQGLRSNLMMLGAVLLTVILQLGVIYIPILNEIFHTQPLPLIDLAVCIALSSIVLWAVEVEKLLVRRGWIYQTQVRAIN